MSESFGISGKGIAGTPSSCSSAASWASGTVTSLTLQLGQSWLFYNLEPTTMRLLHHYLIHGSWNICSHLVWIRLSPSWKVSRQIQHSVTISLVTLLTMAVLADSPPATDSILASSSTGLTALSLSLVLSLSGELLAARVVADLFLEFVSFPIVSREVMAENFIVSTFIGDGAIWLLFLRPRVPFLPTISSVGVVDLYAS